MLGETLPVALLLLLLPSAPSPAPAVVGVVLLSGEEVEAGVGV